MRLVRVVVALSIAALAVATARGQSPSVEPLIQAADITYLGAFALPSGPTGASSFEYGGMALTFFRDASGQATLFMQGHAQKPGQVAQVAIPATVVKSTNWAALPVAKVLQSFATVPNSPDPASCSSNPSFIYGMYAYAQRLIVAAGCSYGGNQTTSHGVRSTNLTQAGFSGFSGFTGASAPPRALGGPITPIPAEWQPLLGGQVMGGLCCISVIGSTSAGPALTVFNPDDVGVKSPIPGKTVLFYDLNHTVAGGKGSEASQNNIFNLTSRIGGVAFVPGTRSVLFVEGHGTGPYCYETAANCNNDTALSDVKGPHAQPYRYQILAYDANDLVAVKNGTKATYDPKPYAVIVLDGMPNSNNPSIAGATLDPTTRRLYITQDYGNKPRVEVYQVGVGNSAVPRAASSLRIIR